MMFPWCFSGLLTSFGDFLADDSGYVQPREGLGLGWVAGALASLAVLFHAPAAQANDPCEGIAPGFCGNRFCSMDVCAEDPDGTPKAWMEKEYCRTGSGNCMGPLNANCICA